MLSTNASTSQPPVAGLTLLRDAELFDPTPRGRSDLLIGGGTLLAIGKGLEAPRAVPTDVVELGGVEDAEGRAPPAPPRLGGLRGGGLGAASRHFLPAVWQEVNRRVLGQSRSGLEIRACALGNGAGRLGAAKLALERLGGG